MQVWNWNNTIYILVLYCSVVIRFFLPGLNVQIRCGYKSSVYDVSKCTCKKLLTSLMCHMRCKFSDCIMSRLDEMFCVMSVTQPDAPVSFCSIMFISSLYCPVSFSNSLCHCVRWNLLDKNAGSGPILIIIICRFINM